MPFASGPVLMYVGRGRYRTVGPTEYVGASDRISIPPDFDTDLASVPRIFWALLPPDGTYERAALLHDWLCASLNRGTPVLSSTDTDGLFRRVARESGTGFVSRWLLWMGVRWGALFNPARRAGWLRTAPGVLGISAVLLAVLLAALIGVHLAVSAVLGAL